MAIHKTEAIVLRTQPFRSSSLIVTLFTRTHGKIKGIAKGVRGEGESRGSLYELFSRLEIIFYEKTRSDLHLLSDAVILECYDALRTRFDGIYYASYFTDLVEQLCEIHDPHEKIFDLLDFQFRYLGSVPGDKLAALFEIKLLNEIGWLPHLGPCDKCSRKVLEHGFFSVRQGVLMCTQCPSRSDEAKFLSAEGVAIIQAYIRNSLEEALKSVNVGKAAQQELRSVMDRFFLERLNRPLKSQIFLQKALQMAPI
ncbi:MAG: DNA repair protein RecO [Omnitrophica bacterium GWA2_52_8]|nr:MAG: DNA repair protein RecO [Omnitrophica bacterium GWA2_52_8]